MARNKDKKMYGVMLGVIVVLALAIFGMSFSITGDKGADDGTGTQTGSVIQCSKDFESTVTFVARDEYEKGQGVNNVTYKVWKVLDGVKIPQADASGELTVGYDESYEVVAMADGYKDVLTTFNVDDECNGPADTVFYMTALPSEIDATFENSKITGPNADDNRIPTGAEITRNVKAIFNGMSKTSTDAIIVIDANKDEFTIDSSLASASQPEEHTTITNYKSYTFDLGTFDGSADLNANFDIVGDEDLMAGDYNISYTIYQYQNGYIDEDSGEYVNTPSVEANDAVLLPTFTGSIYLTAE